MKKYVTNIAKEIYVHEEKVKVRKFKYHERSVIKIYPEKIITRFLGMGGAITEAAAYNYSKLSELNKKNIINDYYSVAGLNYNYGRVSIGSNDFSLKSYEYAKKRDLSDFGIEHDEKLIIPLIKDILNVKNIHLIASPWSPPKMYKKIGISNLGTKLSLKYYEDYSKYLIRFLEEYKKKGINIEYLTIQNEPFAIQPWESCRYSLDEQKKFIYEYLVPKLQETKILLWDHNKEMLYDHFKYLFEKNDKIAGIGFHYYTGRHFNNLKMIHEEYPNALLVNTEMCCGFSPFNEKNWIKDAEIYLADIIGDLNNGVNIYLDWNILLDNKGGPNHAMNYCKSPIILDKDNYIKTPIYYYLYHINHFINRGQVINYSSWTEDLYILSIKDNNRIITVVMNNKNKDYSYKIYFDNEYLVDTILAHSIITYVYE